MASAWALVGRDDELAVLRAAAEERGVVIAGAAGVGKTRLAAEVAGGLEGSGSVVLRATGTAAGSALPLGAFAPLLPGMPDRRDLLGWAADSLVGGSASGRRVLVVDDAHLLDDTSAVLVHQLALTGRARVLLTCRSEVRVPDPVLALWKDQHLERVEVLPLGEADTTRLIRAVLPGVVASRTVDQLCRLTGGNVLYLRHLVGAELAAGRLALSGGVWQWDVPAVLPATLTELVTAQTGAMSKAITEVLEFVAFGEPLDLDGLSSLVTSSAIEEAEQRGLIAVDRGSGAVRPEHPLYGEVVRARTGYAKARRVRSDLVRVLTRGKSPDRNRMLRAAVLHLESDAPADAALLVGATHTALQFADAWLAECLVRPVAKAGDHAARLLWITALSLSGQGSQAETQLGLWDTAGLPDPVQAQAVCLRVGNLLFDLQRADDALSVLDAAEPRSLAVAARSIEGMRSVVLACLGSSAEALDQARRARSGPTVPVARAMVGWSEVLAHACRGQLTEQLAAAESAYRDTSDEESVFRLGLIAFHLTGLRLAGRVHDLGPLLEPIAADAPMTIVPAIGTLGGDVALATGRLRTALAKYEESRGTLSNMAPMGWMFRCLLGQTLVLAQLGQGRTARSALEDLDAHRHDAFAFLEPEVRLAHAWVAASEGRVSAAIAAAVGAGALAQERGHPALEVEALEALTRFGHTDEPTLERLRQLTESVEGPRAPAAQRYAAALRVGDAKGLEDASTEYEAMGDLLTALDSAAHAQWVHARVSDTRDARRLAVRVAQLAELCQHPRTPALSRASSPLPLTSREREIVMLAAQGATNQSIARELVVSVRTVEGHLYRAFAKLGAATRSDLRDILTEGIPPS